MDPIYSSGPHIVNLGTYIFFHLLAPIYSIIFVAPIYSLCKLIYIKTLKKKKKISSPERQWATFEVGVFENGSVEQLMYGPLGTCIEFT